MLATMDNKVRGTERPSGRKAEVYQNAGRSIAELSKRVRSTIEMRALARDFQPGQYDVICARGKRALQHEGNKRFRAMIEKNLSSYSSAANKVEKSLIVSSIIDCVRKNSPHGGFVKEENGQWYEVGDHVAREKTGQRYVVCLWKKFEKVKGLVLFMFLTHHHCRPFHSIQLSRLASYTVQVEYQSQNVSS
jgi:hypothetical protein